jgi:hypothetical protein
MANTMQMKPIIENTEKRSRPNNIRCELQPRAQDAELQYNNHAEEMREVYAA